MPKITYVEPDGSEKEIEGDEGSSLMQIAVDNMIDGITADCGGACSCATCHIKIDPAWMEKVGEPGDIEADMLEFAMEKDDTSRLGCQVFMDIALDGIKVTVPGQGY